jgi:hypothetical protein
MWMAEQRDIRTKKGVQELQEFGSSGEVTTRGTI